MVSETSCCGNWEKACEDDGTLAAKSKVDTDLTAELCKLREENRRLKIVSEIKRIHALPKHDHYGSSRMHKELKKAGVTCCEYTVAKLMRREGNCYDNAPMESFFKSFKTEEVNQTSYQTHEDVACRVVDNIERFFTTQHVCTQRWTFEAPLNSNSSGDHYRYQPCNLAPSKRFKACLQPSDITAMPQKLQRLKLQKRCPGKSTTNLPLSTPMLFPLFVGTSISPAPACQPTKE